MRGSQGQSWRHHPQPGFDTHIIRQVVPTLARALTITPQNLTCRRSLETNAFWVSARSVTLLRQTDWDWVQRPFLQFVSGPVMDRLLTVRTEWSRK